MPKIEPFENYFSLYEEWFERYKFVYDSELQALREQIPKGGLGLEIGVGSGRFAARLGIKHGVEPSGKMRELARSRGIEALEGIAEALPFSSSLFDYAVMVTSISFFDNIYLAFKEAARVLKPGGSLIIGFIDRESSLGRVYQEYRDENVFYKDATFYTVHEVISYLKEIGFKDFYFTQTIFQELNKIREIEPIKPGYGEGSFVVIKTCS